MDPNRYRPCPDGRCVCRLGRSDPGWRDCRRCALAALGGGGGRRRCGISAFALAVSPIFVVVFASRILQAGASCVLGPAIAAISLGLVGRKGISTRLGRNAAFASVGSGVAAAGMGASAYYISDRAAFILAASMTVPALFALFQIRTHEIDPARAHGGVAKSGQGNAIAGLLSLFEIRPLLIFAGCIALFQLANAAMLPLAASMMTLRSSKFATILVATSIVAPQLIVAVLSPWVGRKAELRTALVACSLLRRFGDPWSVVRVSDQSLSADGRATPRRRLRRSAGGVGSTDHRGCCRRHRSFQPGAGGSRLRGRARRVDQHHPCRLHQRSVRQPDRFSDDGGIRRSEAWRLWR